MFIINKNRSGQYKMYSVTEILKHLELAMEQKLPFSFVRFGDGGIKYMHSILYSDRLQLDSILKKEGIPRSKHKWLLRKWAECASNADYIDSPEIYFTDRFWPRVRLAGGGGVKQMTSKTIQRLRMWKSLYDRCKFNNDKYINPELNYILCTRMDDRWTLLDLMKGKKICVIGISPKIKDALGDYDVDFVPVAPHYENQYNNSLVPVLDTIEKDVHKYDLWIVCAGEIGRVYSGFIKNLGGRCIDMGFVLEYWITGEVPERLVKFIKQNPKNKNEFVLTKEGKRYQEWL